MTMTLIETITVGSGGAASIEFTGIDGGAKHLLLKISGRSDNTNSFNFTVNSNTSSIYSFVSLFGNGSDPYSTSGSSGFGGYTTKNDVTANTFSSNELYFSNYSSSSNKSVALDGVTENNATFALAYLNAASIATTAAITSIQLIPSASQTWVEHSTASLYSIS